MSAAKKLTVFEQLKGGFFDSIVPVGVESLRLLPDSVVCGTAILTILSGCKSYGVLLFSMFELMFLQRISSMIIGGIAPVGGDLNSQQMTCQPGFQYTNSMRISLLEKIGTPSMFPSPTMFFLCGLLSYMLMSMRQFGREIKSLSGDIQARTQVAIVLSVLFTIAMLMFRTSYGCESFGTLLLSLLLGTIFGIAMVFQNIALFGRDGINVLNLPMIQSALEKGKPMYVCAPSDI